MAAAQGTGEVMWRAAALDVRGPGTRGRRDRRGGGDQADAFATGDRGELWIQDGALYFAGRHEAWSVPLGWLGAPEADLSGTIELPIRTADRGHAISLRLVRGDDEERLGEAIQRSRLEAPDPRDRRALQDLLVLLQPELERLDQPAEGGGDAAPRATRLLAAAARLRATSLPYWGDPASRLRYATIGALVAAGEASQADADAAAQERYDQAIRRWHNVCEDLHDWCGLPESPEKLPAPRRSEMQAGASTAAEATTPPVAQQQAAGSPEPAAAASSSSAPAETATAQRPEQPGAAAPEPEPPHEPALELEDEADPNEEATVLAPMRGRYQASVPAAAPAPPAQPPHLSEENAVYDEEATLIVGTPSAMRQPPAPIAPAAPSPVAAESTPPAPAQSVPPAPPPAAEPPPPEPPPAMAESAPPAPVVTGPGRRGSGGMTMLYRRSGTGPGGQVARKELQPEGVSTADARETFLRIGERFAAVQHPNFVRILEIGTAGDSTPYIDMEFVEGEGISARLRRGPLPPDQALEIVEQLAGAVDAVHQAGLVHGDVRPLNVLLEPGGRAVLLEPSVACDYVLEQRRGTIYGELSYLTPERVRGEAGEARGDIYALGSLAFALLTGRPPFEGESADIFAGHADQTPAALDSVMPGAPAAASAAIARSLAKHPADRQPRAEELATALRRAFAGSPQPSAAPSPLGGPAPSPLGGPAPSPLGGPAPSPLGGSPPSMAPQPPGLSQPPAAQPAAAPPPLERRPTEQVSWPAAPATPPAGPPASPPGRTAPSPLGRSAPGPLGRNTPSAAPPPTTDQPDDDDDDLDRTIIVRPPR